MCLIFKLPGIIYKIKFYIFNIYMKTKNLSGKNTKTLKVKNTKAIKNVKAIKAKRETQAQIRERVSAFKVTDRVYFENKGDKGDKGDQGPQGPQGLQGPNGPYKPVNYVQEKLDTPVINPAAGGIVIRSPTITTTNRPVQVMCSGDLNSRGDIDGGAWGEIILVRDDAVELGNSVFVETYGRNENRSYCIQVIDTSAPAGPHTYGMKLLDRSAAPNYPIFGEVDGPVINAREL